MAGALLLALVLTATVLPVAGAIPLHALTLALIQSAQTPYWSPEPYMTGQLTLNKEYVPPREWNGSQFVPAIVNISASASDQDTYHMWFNDIYSPFMSLDVVTGDITGPAGYTDVNPWLGTTATGQFSTVNCGGQTQALVPYPISFYANDAAPNPGRDDTAVNITKDINVVLPNAVTTTGINHVEPDGYHIGDMFRHTFFYQPSDVSQQNPAPNVSYAHYWVLEADWYLIDVDESGGLDADEVQEMFDNEKINWIMCRELSSESSIDDTNVIDRGICAEEYGDSFKNPGSFRLKQGLRVISPNSGDFIYVYIEHHFPDEASENYPGEAHTCKEGYSRTSLVNEWVECPNHSNGCDY